MLVAKPKYKQSKLEMMTAAASISVDQFVDKSVEVAAWCQGTTETELLEIGGTKSVMYLWWQMWAMIIQKCSKGERRDREICNK